jgi:hypothetical protein
MEERILTPREWAQWVLMGDDIHRVPAVLEPIAMRIEQAIRQDRQQFDPKWRKPVISKDCEIF